MKNVLILGGSYFCGRVLVESLAQVQNCNLFVYNRGKVPLGLPRVTELRGDRRVAQEVRHIPPLPWYAVVDFCAYEPADVLATVGNIPGQVRRYLLVSTTSVYAESSELPLAEDAAKVSAPQGELGPYAEYGLNKWKAELALIDQCLRREIEYVVLRPAIVYGKYNYVPREALFFERIRKAARILIPQESQALFSFLWAFDLARALFECLRSETACNRIYNASGPERVSYRAFVELLREAVGAAFEIEERPLEELLRAKVELPFPPDRHLLYSGEKLRRELSFEYTPLVEGLKATYEHYRRLHGE